MNEDADETQRADREIARARDLLGLGNAHLTADDQLFIRVLNKADAEPAPAALRRPPVARRLPLVAAVVVLVVVAVVSLVRPSPAVAAPPGLHYSVADPADAGAAGSASARDELRRLAEAVMSGPAEARGNQQFVDAYGWYLAIDSDAARGSVIPISSRSWLAPDGSSLTRTAAGTPLRTDGSLDPDPIGEPSEPVGEQVNPPGSFLDPTLAALPREPDALRADRLGQLPGLCDSDEVTATWCLLTDLVSLASLHVLPADLAAAYWTVLAEDPNVVLLGNATDRLGRDVVAVAGPPFDEGYGPSVTVILLEATTGRMVGSETVTLESDLLGITEPTVTGFTAIRTARFVQAAGDTE